MQRYFMSARRSRLRVAADYVGQDLFAFGGTIGNATDVYSRHRLTLDLGSSYAISP